MGNVVTITHDDGPITNDNNAVMRFDTPSIDTCTRAVPIALCWELSADTVRDVNGRRRVLPFSALGNFPD